MVSDGAVEKHINNIFASSAWRPPTATTGGCWPSCATWGLRDMTGSLPMTPGRWVALVIGVPLALLVIGWTALTAVAFAGLGRSGYSHRAHPVATRAGQLPGSRAAAVTGAAVSSRRRRDRAAAGGGRTPADREVHYSLVRPQLSWQRSASTIALHARCRVPTGACSFNYAVTVPAGGRSVASTGSGNLTAKGLAGTVTLSTDRGTSRPRGSPAVPSAAIPVTSP